MFTLRVRNRLHPSRRNLAIAGVTALLSTAVSGILPAQAVGGVTAGSTITFSPTGAEQSFVVPAGATMMRVTLAGAPGNDTYPGFSAGNTAVGGLGSLVTADIPAPVAGSTVYAEAGGLSTWGGNATGVGGFNGGGNGRPGSGGGGGATDLRTVSNVTGGTLTSRLAVAAGGGGAGTGGADVNNICYFNGCPPGNGGSAQAASANGGAGQDGPNTRGTASYHFGGYPGVAGGQGGAGGSQTAGGAGGQQQNPNNNCDIQSIPFGGVGGSPGAPGTLGIGGQGSTTQTGCSLGQGGGGGGGYYGGGGADGGNGLGTTSGPYASGGGGGGGAGSSYVASSAVTSAFAVDSTKTPRISITFNPTTTSVACSPASIAVNSPTTCTATVASVDTSDVVAATGTVSLTRTAGAGTLGATSCSLDATGSCSVPYTPDLGSTAHTIAAAYPGDDAHAASSGSGNLTSTRRTTATTAACVPTTSPVNSSVTCTATVGDSDAGTTSLPAGTVSWTTAGWGTFSPTSCTVAAGQCSVAFTPSPGHEGNAVIAPAYGGDANHLSSSGAATVPATRRASTATATCTPNDAPVNAATTCTASVHDSTGGTAVTPGGSVSWTVSSGPGSVTPSSCTLASASCSVTYTPAPGSEGLHSLALTYVGDTDHTGSNGDAGLTAVTRTTSAAASCSPVTVAVSAPTTCTATVSDTSAGTTMQPTGAVSWTVGSGSGDLSQPTCNLASGACSVTYTPAPGSSGPHSLHAVYAGDDDHSGSVDNAALTAGRRSTATTAGCSATSATVNATVSCVATVTDTAAGSTSAPTGVATWSLQSGKGTFSPTTCQVLVGFCFTTFTPDPGSVGPDTIRATYGADTDHAGSTGQYVFAINARSTTSSVACSPTTVQVNQATTCTATVTDSDAATPITPTGIVDWTAPGASGALSAPSCTLSSSTCSVTFTPTAGSEGANPLVTAYTGDGDHSGSGSGASVTASQRAATVAASCAPNTQVMNSATTCTAMVTDTDAATAVTATGTIAWTVTSGSGDLSTPSCSLVAGVCSVTYTPAIGSPTAHSLEASYNGDADHAAGTAPAAVTVERRAATVTATCSPASTVVNSATECSAVVADASPSTTVEPDGTVAWTVSDGAGALDTTSCTLVSGSCSVNYTPAPGSAGDQTLHASYSGDTAHQAVAQDAAVTALRRSVFLTELCTGITGHITVPVSCIASVRDSDAGTPVAPTGRVSWSLQGGGGSFSTTSCTLSSGQCAVQYRPDAGTAGAQTVEAHYVGDGSHVSGVTTFDYSVTVVPVTMDAYGHLRGSDGVSLTTSRAPVWATKLARGQALISGQTGGYTLDAYGGVHAWGSATRVVTTAHWSGWDIARDIALNPCDSSQKSGYVLDGYGALHAFGHAPSVRMSAYFSGRDIAKAFALNPCSDGVVSGYVLDGFGSLHSFTSGAAITSPASAHWRGWNIARGVIVIRSGAGYTLDGFGALHAFGGAPALRRAPAYFGWDIARDVVALSEGGGYTVDGFGGLHAFGTAHSVPGSGYTRGNDIYRFVGIG